ncbi:MAG: hypothetical protein VYD57_18685 [Pseudomonadota bacterium]|nr:hypothetical protein [Pseudomonadota bacterium]
MNPDFECTFFPNVILGVRLTDCCVVHDLSPLDTASAIDLGVCVAQTMAAANPMLAVVGALVGGVMTLGAGVWTAARYGPRGIRRR